MMKAHPKKDQGPLIRLSLSVAMLYSVFGAADVMAQPTVDCTRPITFGRVVRCGVAANVAVTPVSSLVQAASCLELLDTPKVARCKVSTVIPQTRSIQMMMTQAQFNLGGTAGLLLDQFNIGTKSAGDDVLFPPSTFTKTENFINIGGRLTVGGAQASGKYTGSISVSVTFP